MEIDKKLLTLATRKDEARSGGGDDRIRRHHEGGKYTARERVEMLLDEGSFEEFDIF